jgi:hypothetical protein
MLDQLKNFDMGPLLTCIAGPENEYGCGQKLRGEAIQAGIFWTQA